MLRNLDGNPVEFKTLNLDKIIKFLNSVANDEFKPTKVAICFGFNCKISMKIIQSIIYSLIGLASLG